MYVLSLHPTPGHTVGYPYSRTGVGKLYRRKTELGVASVLLSREETNVIFLKYFFNKRKCIKCIMSVTAHHINATDCAVCS
jgi:catalase